MSSELELAEAELELLELEAQQQTSAPAQPAVEAAPPKEYEPGWLDRLNAGVEGASLGFGDEMRAGTEALINWEDSDNTWGERYDALIGPEREKMAKYASAEPGTNLALTLAGGILSGGATMAGAVPNTMKLLPRAAAGLGVAAAEGGLAGYGGADEGEELKGALTGAAGGATLKALTGAGSALFKGVEKLPSLGGKNGEAFTPANLAAPDSVTGGLMKSTFGRSLGGGKIREQTQKVVDGIDSTIKATDEQYAGRLFRSSTPLSFDRAKITKDNPQKSFAAIKKSWNEDAFSNIKDTTFRINDKDINREIFAALDDPALQDFTPEMSKIISGKVGSKMARDMVPPPKSRQFTSSGVGVAPVAPKPSDEGSISGSDLLEARNYFRRKVNSLGDAPEARLHSAAYAKAADVIETNMRKQLDPSELNRFDEELASYGRYSVLRKAMAKASKTPADLPTPKQVMASIGTGDRVASGTAPHQKLTATELKRNAGLVQARKKATDAMPAETGGVQQVAQAGILGSIASLAKAPFMVMPAIGAGVSSAATFPTAQRAIAGQLGPQELIADILRKKTTEAIGTGVRRAGAGHIADEF